VNDHEIAIVNRIAAAFDDEYGSRPSRYILEITLGTVIGGGIDDLITLARMHDDSPATPVGCECGDCIANATIPGFVYNTWTGEYIPDRVLTQDECDLLGLDGRDGTGTYTLAKAMASLTKSRRAVYAQEQWIRMHGGDEEGYIERYGNSHWPADMRYGDGGQAIYAADMADLNRLRGEMSIPVREPALIFDEDDGNYDLYTGDEDYRS
jgi:hypothetical protein